MENVVILQEAAKSPKRYKCPFCDYRGTKEELVYHVQEEHEDMIPQDYTAARVVFNHIYNKKHGSCIICKDETEWNEENWRYEKFCKKERCRKEYRERFKRNMKKSGKEDIMNDAEHQKKMLANRSISGEYKFKDGGIRSYTGSYEKKALEFMDEVLGIHSKDIMTPGPVFEYDFKGSTKKFITDILYIPYNLVFDVKDGGSNKNTHPNLKEFREKQEAKEEAIKKAGTHNYIRLTDNNFEQLMQIFAELKANMINDDNSPVIHINELAYTPSAPDNKKFVLVYSKDGVTWEHMYTKHLGITTEGIQNLLVFEVLDDISYIQEMTVEEFLYDPRVDLLEAVGFLDDPKDIVSKMYSKDNIVVNSHMDTILYTDSYLRKLCKDTEKKIYDLVGKDEDTRKYITNGIIENAIILTEKAIPKVPLTPKERELIKSRFGKIECSIGKTKQGQYYAYTHRARTKFYDSIEKLPKDKVKFISSTS